MAPICLLLILYVHDRATYLPWVLLEDRWWSTFYLEWWERGRELWRDSKQHLKLDLELVTWPQPTLRGRGEPRIMVLLCVPKAETIYLVISPNKHTCEIKMQIFLYQFKAWIEEKGWLSHKTFRLMVFEPDIGFFSTFRLQLKCLLLLGPEPFLFKMKMGILFGLPSPLPSLQVPSGKHSACSPNEMGQLENSTEVPEKSWK